MATPVIPGYTNLTQINGIWWGQPTGMGANANWTMLYDPNDTSGSALTTNPTAGLAGTGGGTKVAADLALAGIALADIPAIEQLYNNLLVAQGTYQNTIAQQITPTAFGSWVLAKGTQGATNLFNEGAGIIIKTLKGNTDGGGNIIDPTITPPVIDPTTGGNTTTPTLPWGGDDTQGFWDEKPQATYQARLKMAGINPNTPMGKYQSENFYNAYLPYLLSSPTAWAGGGTPTSFGSSTPSTQVTPGMMTQAMGLSQDPTTPGGQVRGYLESEGMTNPLVSGMAQASGAPYALRQYMSGKAGDYRTDWESGGPSQVNTFMEYLNNMFGNRF